MREQHMAGGNLVSGSSCSQPVAAPAPAEPGAEHYYRWVVLVTLLAAYVLNFMDRWVITILAQPIKEEMKLADWQLGLFNGFAYALLSSALGFKLARLAERRNRANIITGCMLVWSAMTALCGLASGFWQMLLLRMGVGIGEAGAMPSAHALIADYFPPRLRATAHSIYGLGLPLGGMFGMVLGGFIADHWGWRTAFVVVGLPGIVFAGLLRLIVREPPRGRYDPPPASAQAPSAGAVLRLLWSTPTARHILIALTLSVLIGNASATFLAPYLVRKFHLSYTDVALIVGGTNFLSAAFGMLTGGLLADRLGRRDRRWYMWVPALGVVGSVFCYLVAYWQEGLIPLALMLVPGGFLVATYLAPSFAVLQNIVEPRMRATTTAVAGICMSLIGMGLGPLLGGLTIDRIAAHLFAAQGLGEFTAACPGGLAPAGAAPALVAACPQVLSVATQATLLLWTPLMLWPAFHYWRAGRTVGKDARF